MRGWPFGKPKTPGFGISANFYLTVLSSKPVLPAITDFIAPDGLAGRIEGFGAPLSNNKEKSSLIQPLERGAYVLATKDRKTVLKMLVMSADEAGFDSEAYARSSYSVTANPELLARIRGTWTLMQMKFESHDPAVYPAIDFFLKICQKLAAMSDGVVADKICQRYLLPEEVFVPQRLDPRVDARECVSISQKERSDGTHIFTLGLQKFELPELEIVGITQGDFAIASRFLITLAQSALMGDLVKSGDRFGAPGALFEAREGGFDASLWEGIPVLELLPPTLVTPTAALDAWKAALANPAL